MYIGEPWNDGESGGEERMAPVAVAGHRAVAGLGSSLCEYSEYMVSTEYMVSIIDSQLYS